jgi:hypothetical protein
MGNETDRAREFVERLADAYGADLVAAALYGSAARGEYREGVSDVNVLVVLRTVDADVLRRGSSLAVEWAAGGNPPPLVMSESEWTTSADVFPIEYADIRDAHVLLHGQELFADLAIAWDDMRLQAERELKEKKIQLRERYLLAATSAEEIGRLLWRSFPTFLALFRASLRLMGESVPRDPEAVIALVADRIGIDPRPWTTVQRARAEGANLALNANDPMVAAYLDGVTRAAEWIDGLERTGDHPGV